MNQHNQLSYACTLAKKVVLPRKDIIIIMQVQGVEITLNKNMIKSKNPKVRDKNQNHHH